MLVFNKLWIKTAEMGLSKTDFRIKLGFSTSTLAKLSKNQPVSLEVIDRICDFFKCQPNDIMTHYTEDEKIAAGREANAVLQDMVSSWARLEKLAGMPIEQMVMLLPENERESAKQLITQIKSSDGDYVGVEKYVQSKLNDAEGGRS